MSLTAARNHLPSFTRYSWISYIQGPYYVRQTFDCMQLTSSAIGYYIHVNWIPCNRHAIDSSGWILAPWQLLFWVRKYCCFYCWATGQSMGGETAKTLKSVHNNSILLKRRQSGLHYTCFYEPSVNEIHFFVLFVTGSVLPRKTVQ